MKKIILTLPLFLLFAEPALAATNTASATVKVFKAYLSANGDCSSPITILDEPTGKSVDMAAGPTIGSGSIADGTYKCAIFKMSDQVTFVPSANDGTACVAGTAYTIDVCRTQGSTTMTVKNPEDGSLTTCTTGDDTVWVYVSRFSTSTGGSQTSSAFTPPTADGDATNGMKLNNDVVIAGNVTGTFTFGTNGKIDGSSNAPSCDMQPPDFGFKTQ